MSDFDEGFPAGTDSYFGYPSGLADTSPSDASRAPETLLGAGGSSPDVGALMNLFGGYTDDAVGAQSSVLQLDEIQVEGDPNAPQQMPEITIEGDRDAVRQGEEHMRKQEYSEGFADGASGSPHRQRCTRYDAEYDAGYAAGLQSPDSSQRREAGPADRKGTPLDWIENQYRQWTNIPLHEDPHHRHMDHPPHGNEEDPREFFPRPPSVMPRPPIR